MSYRPKNILVTGGAGFIGADFVHYWLRECPDSQVTVLDAFTYAGNLQNLECVMDNNVCDFVHGDILDADLVEKLLRENIIDTIVHFAAEIHVDRSIHRPDASEFTEQHQCLPNSPHAASKVSSDHIVCSYHHAYGLNTTISNCSNNFEDKQSWSSVMSGSHREWLYKNYYRTSYFSYSVDC